GGQESPYGQGPRRGDLAGVKPLFGFDGLPADVGVGHENPRRAKWWVFPLAPRVFTSCRRPRRSPASFVLRHSSCVVCPCAWSDRWVDANEEDWPSLRLPANSVNAALERNVRKTRHFCGRASD